MSAFILLQSISRNIAQTNTKHQRYAKLHKNTALRTAPESWKGVKRC